MASRRKKLEITIHTSNMTSSDGERSVYGKIPLKAVKIDKVIDDIEKVNPGINSATLLHAVSLLQSEILEKLSDGYAVDLLGLGLLYPTMKGRLTEFSPVALANHIKVGFKPSERTKQAVKGFEVSTCAEPVKQHYISSVKPAIEGEEIVSGALLRLLGKGLKLSGSGAGVFVRGRAGGDERACKAAGSKAGELLFFLPEDMEEGEYIATVETGISAGGKALKQNVRFSSNPFTVHKRG